MDTPQTLAALDAEGRVALVHDWLTGMRGGERCLEVFCELFPDAPIFTLLHVPGSVSPAIERHRIVTSFVQRLPGAATGYRHYLPLFPAAVRGLSLRGFDLVLSLSHCVAKAVRVGADALHLCYCFTPMRYVWDLEADYARGRGRLARLALPPAAALLRRWDRRTAGVAHFVAISQHIADRIRRVYGRAADVIHPPVEVDRFRIAPAVDDYYLVVSALVLSDAVATVLRWVCAALMLLGAVGWVRHWFGVAGRQAAAVGSLVLLAAYAGAQAVASVPAKHTVRRAAVARFGETVEWAALTRIGKPFRWEPIFASRDTVAGPGWALPRHLDDRRVQQAQAETAGGRALSGFARFLAADVDSDPRGVRVTLRDARFARTGTDGWAVVTVPLPPPARP